MSHIYHITSRAAWQQALQTGEYRPESLAREGFIHFSTREQLLTVANAFYRGQSDLVVLAVETERLHAELRYEPPVHPKADEEADKAVEKADAETDKTDGEADGLPSAALFPHLYGALNTDAVVQVIELIPNEQGGFEASRWDGKAETLRE